MDDYSRRTDEELLAELDSLAARERTELPGFLARLAEVERRGVYLDAGYRSLFDYCVLRLKLSEGIAYQRLCASRACARMPELYARLRDGELNLSGVVRLAPFLQGEDAAALIARASGLKRAALDALIDELGRQRARPEAGAQAPETPLEPAPAQELFPSAGVPGGIPAEISRVDSLPSEPQADRAASASPRFSSAGPRAPRDLIRHQAVGAVRIAFTADEALLSRLELARALLGRRHDGRLESVLSLVLDDYIARHDPARWGAGVRTRGAGKARASSRRVPREVKAAVWRRDGGRCAFVAPDGTRCAARKTFGARVPGAS